VEYSKYLGSIITNDRRCTCENIYSIAMAKTTFNKKGLFTSKVKGKAFPLHAWGGPEDSMKLRFPDFLTTAQNGGKFASLTHRPHLPPGNTPGTHFC
jgi:hypothetical protein